MTPPRARSQEAKLRRAEDLPEAPPTLAPDLRRGRPHTPPAATAAAPPHPPAAPHPSRASPPRTPAGATPPWPSNPASPASSRPPPPASSELLDGLLGGGCLHDADDASAGNRLEDCLDGALGAELLQYRGLFG